jgi:hypothetical protein
MSFINDLPEDVVHLIRSGMVAEYASVTAKGIPIDTPTYYFPSEDVSTLDIGTGLAYPAKAERVRRNPCVGLLIEGEADQPVVSIAGFGAVRDSDIQANLNRYVAETCHMLPPGGAWEAMRKAVFYWSRVFVAVAPARILWWPDREAAHEAAPKEWRAPADTDYPPSDPKPAGKMSSAPEWPLPPWQDVAEMAMERAAPGHLTLCDAEGFPLPLRVRSIERHGEGFSMEVPRSAPWSSGPATLSFQGREVFIGHAEPSGGRTLLRVERAMPIFPLTSPDLTVPRPDRETRARLTARMEEELARRGLPTPVVPEDMPPPTTHSLMRIEAIKAKMARSGTAG